MPVFLIGYMGSGKSTVGRELAKYMDVDFIDIDKLIEKEFGAPIFDIFNDKGESFFREKEHSILTSFNFPSKSIIATGGGTPCFFDNLNFMKQKGSTLYLKLTPNELYQRLKFQNDRPLLYNNKLNLRDFINMQLSERQEYYHMSHYTIESDDIKIDELFKLVNKII